jgi:hypothetical protein
MMFNFTFDIQAGIVQSVRMARLHRAGPGFNPQSQYSNFCFCKAKEFFSHFFISKIRKLDNNFNQSFYSYEEEKLFFILTR